MAEDDIGSVLKRKAAAGRDGAPGGRPATPTKALGQAFTRAADSELDLVLTVKGCTARLASLAELLETLPEGGLLAVLEGPGDGQGLMALDGYFLSALIEKQMTGAVSTAAPQPRRPTRTDASLSADLIDAVLRAFEAPLLGREEARWAAGFGYASFLDDPRPLGLLLEEIEYRVFSVTADLEKGAREGRALLALPAEGRGAIGTAAGQPGATPPPPPEDVGEAWRATLEAHVMNGEVRLEAVLHRFRLPIAAIGTLQVGQEIPIPAAAIGRTRLTGADGSTAAIGKLGQSGGMRALRLVPADGVSAPAPPGADLAKPPAGAPPPLPALPGAGDAGGDPGGDPDSGGLPDFAPPGLPDLAPPGLPQIDLSSFDIQ